MVARFLKWFFGDVAAVAVNIKPVYLDAFLYTVAAVFIFLQGYFSGEEAYKYVNPYFLYWFKAFIGSLTAGAVALKMFRSDSFSKHERDEAIKNQKENG